MIVLLTIYVQTFATAYQVFCLQSDERTRPSNLTPENLLRYCTGEGNTGT